MSNEDRIENGKKLAKRARLNAYNTYMFDSWACLSRGDTLMDVDPAGAYAHWCAGMHALDCALTVKEGMDA